MRFGRQTVVNTLKLMTHHCMVYHVMLRQILKIMLEGNLNNWQYQLKVRSFKGKFRKKKLFTKKICLDFPVQVKPTKRSHLLKKKALTTSLFDSSKNKDERGEWEFKIRTNNFISCCCCGKLNGKNSFNDAIKNFNCFFALQNMIYFFRMIFIVLLIFLFFKQLKFK